MLNQFNLSVLIPQFQPMTDAIALWTEAISRRQIRRSYGLMTDAQLRDIGRAPHELEVALSLPLTCNASDNLAEAAAAEATKW